MKLRMPAIPLITVDPYFSVWSRDEINRVTTEHWTGAPNTIRGTVTVDGTVYRFLGNGPEAVIPQVSVDADALSTVATFENEAVRLTARFTTPILADDLYLSSRPVSYLKLTVEPLDGRDHTVTARLCCSEELVLNKAGEGRACSAEETVAGLTAIRMGSGAQQVLWRSGDLIRIDWGWFYLAAAGKAAVGNTVLDGRLYAVYAEVPLEREALFLFAYDDVASIEYFGQQLPAYWKKDGKTITEALAEAAAEYDTLTARCHTFAARLAAEATAKGGEEYAELVQLAYRQVMAAHKLVADADGQALYISKECNSNGCAATVDVTYPSAPMYLYYNTELLRGMLRPVFRFARSEMWPYDFAPHDVGQYPLLNRQVYGLEGDEYLHRAQMPLEECGNVIVLVAAMCERDGDYTFARENMDLLERWKNYLLQYGEDPEDQLCTDDFAGHLAHNCNLSLKAIMGLMGYARILQGLGKAAEAATVADKARAYARSFLDRAANGDGSYRLAYDRPDTFSLKYNAVWDRLWNTALLPQSFYDGEIARYKREARPYGVPLDSRETYTKADWEHWAACLATDEADFADLTHRLWLSYHVTRDRVPMTDWYYADTTHQRYFRHRSVMGGLFLKLLFQ